MGETTVWSGVSSQTRTKMDFITSGIVLVIVLACVAAYMAFGEDLKRSATRRAERRRQLGTEYDRFKDTENNPFIPDFIEMHPGRSTVLAILLVALLIVGLNSVHSVPAGHRGVVVTFGAVKEVNLPEGLQFKLPFVQRIINMKVTLEKEEVVESAASSDLQEIMTTLTVHFNVNPDMAWQMYRNMRSNYHNLLLKPIIQEDLKATTAQFTAEELIKSRSLLVQKLKTKLSESLEPYGIQIQTVNFVNFEFTEVFMDAIEAKVTAEQHALEALNYLEQIKHEAQQKIIQAEADRSAMVITAEANQIRVELEALAEAFKVLTEANATAEAIQMITGQMTPEYAQYLHLLQWDGEYPTTMLGTMEDLGIIITP